MSDITLEAKPGQITAIIGPSGSGKSTLIRALSLLDPPTSGSVELDGRRYDFPMLGGSRNSPPWPMLGVVFQQLFLWPHLTLRQNILLPLKLRGLVRVQARVRELIAHFELEEAAERFPNETSLGQRQRAAFIRALVLEPHYLLLDEITSALDVEHVGKVLNELRDIRSRGVSVIAVTHLLGFARRSADQVLFLDGGRIVEQGAPSILTAPQSPRLKQFLSLADAAS